MRYLPTLFLLAAACNGNSGGGDPCVDIDPLQNAFETGTYTTTLDGGVPQSILDAFGDPAVGDVTLVISETTATLNYVNVDGDDVEVVMELGELGEDFSF